MTYYEHASGAKVFSAGVAQLRRPDPPLAQTARLLDNVWRRLSNGL